MSDILDSCSEPSLELEPILGFPESIQVFKQGVVKHSRKQVLPIIQAFLNGDLTPDVTSKDFMPEADSVVSQEGFSSFSDITGHMSESADVDQQSDEPACAELDTNLPHVFITGIESPMPMSGQSSNQTSEPDSGYPSYPVTPPNSVMESKADNYVKEYILPSFNSSEMVKKIQEKKAAIGSNHFGNESPELELVTSTPFTPHNSYADKNLEQFEKQHHLTSFNSSNMVQKIMDRRTELGHCSEESSHSDLQNIPYTPANSLVDANFDKFANNNLSSLNNAETVQKIQAKKEMMTALSEGVELKIEKSSKIGIDIGASGHGYTSVPYTPQNSFSDAVVHPAHIVESEALKKKLGEIESPDSDDFEHHDSEDTNFFVGSEMVLENCENNGSGHEIERVEVMSRVTEPEVVVGKRPPSATRVNSSDNDNNLNFEAETLATKDQTTSSIGVNDEDAEVVSECEIDRTEVTSPLLDSDFIHGKFDHGQILSADLVNSSNTSDINSSQNTVAQSIANEMRENTDQLFTNPKTENIVTQNIKKDMLESVNIAGNNFPEDIVAENIAGEMSRDMVESLVTDSLGNKVIENIAGEMIDDLAETSSTSTSVAKNIAMEMKQDMQPLSENSAVAESIARELIQSTVDNPAYVEKMAAKVEIQTSDNDKNDNLEQATVTDTDNVVAANITREMAKDLGENVSQADKCKLDLQNTAATTNNITANNIMDEMLSGGGQATMNLVTETLIGEMKSDKISCNIVAENLANEMLSDDNTSCNVVAENISQEMHLDSEANMSECSQSETIQENIFTTENEQFSINSSMINSDENIPHSNNVHALNSLGRTCRKDVVSEKTGNVVAFGMAQEMMQDQLTGNITNNNECSAMDDVLMSTDTDTGKEPPGVVEGIAYSITEGLIQNALESFPDLSNPLVAERVTKEFDEGTVEESQAQNKQGKNI